MFAGKALRCDCGYEVRGNNEDELVEAVQRHALEAHHIEFTLELAREVARSADSEVTRKEKQ
jgi:predicted small metal-binding protein